MNAIRLGIHSKRTFFNLLDCLNSNIKVIKTKTAYPITPWGQPATNKKTTEVKLRMILVFEKLFLSKRNVAIDTVAQACPLAAFHQAPRYW